MVAGFRARHLAVARDRFGWTCRRSGRPDVAELALAVRSTATDWLDLAVHADVGVRTALAVQDRTG